MSWADIVGDAPGVDIGVESGSEQAVLPEEELVSLAGTVLFTNEVDGRVGNFGTRMLGGLGVEASPADISQFVEVGVFVDEELDEGVRLVVWPVVSEQVSDDIGAMVVDVDVDKELDVLRVEDVGVSHSSDEEDRVVFMWLVEDDVGDDTSITDTSQAVLEPGVLLAEHPQWLVGDVWELIFVAPCSVAQRLSEASLVVLASPAGEAVESSA